MRYFGAGPLRLSHPLLSSYSAAGEAVVFSADFARGKETESLGALPVNISLIFGM